MPGAQHLMFAREPSWGTWTTPNSALPITTVGIGGDQPIIGNDDTGQGRSTRPGVAGALTVEGDIATHLYPRGLGKILRSLYGTRARTPSVSATTVAVSAFVIGAYPGPGTQVTTAVPHNLRVGDRITIAGATGGTPTPNGERTVISVTSATVFAIDLTTTGTAATGGTVAKTSIRNKFLPQDDTAYDSFSIQKRYSSLVAESIRGLKVKGYTVSASAGELAEVTLSCHAQDNATVGATASWWTDGTTPAPAVVDPTGLYGTGINDPIAFVGGSLTLGGTIGVVAGELVYTGGTMRHSIDNIELNVETALITDDLEVYLDSRLLGSLGEAKRMVTLSFEPNQDVVGNEFFAAWKAGADAVAKLAFQGRPHGATGVREGFEWTFPLVRYNAAPNADLSGTYDIQRVPVEANCYGDPTTGFDHGLVITSGEDYTI